MKKSLIFGGGVLTGVILTFLSAIAVTISKQSGEIDGLTMFEQPGEVVPYRSYKVIQSITKGATLTTANDDGYFLGPVCLLMDFEGKYYYDDEIVSVHHGEVARQIGIYQYRSQGGINKTVPVVRIMDK